MRWEDVFIVFDDIGGQIGNECLDRQWIGQSFLEQMTKATAKGAKYPTTN